MTPAQEKQLKRIAESLERIANALERPWGLPAAEAMEPEPEAPKGKGK